MEKPEKFDPSLEPHELALQFPDLGPEQFASLREDLRKHGLQHAIVLDSERRIIDGRHRYKALLELYYEYQKTLQGTDLTQALKRLNFHTRQVEEGAEADFALSSNLARRHLSPSQRCMIVARSQLHDRRGKRRRWLNVSKLAEQYGLQRVTLYKAEYVLEKCKVAAAADPQHKLALLSLPQRVVAGEISVGLAERQITAVLGSQKPTEPVSAEGLASLARDLSGQIEKLGTNQGGALSSVAALLRRLERTLSVASSLNGAKPVPPSGATKRRKRGRWK